MKKSRLYISLSLCLCLCICLPLFAVCATADTSADTSAETLAEGSGEAVGGNETPLSPVERVFQVISLVILFGGIAMLPVYYVLNRRRKTIIASFDRQKEAEGETADETNT